MKIFIAILALGFVSRGCPYYYYVTKTPVKTHAFHATGHQAALQENQKPAPAQAR
jgi:hypothetical protein